MTNVEIIFAFSISMRYFTLSYEYLSFGRGGSDGV